MSDQEQITLKKWLGEHYMTLFWIGLFTTIAFFMVPHAHEIIDNWEKNKEETRKINEFNTKQYGILRYSDDCNELRQAINLQLSGGANTDSWWPDYDEKVTKIGKQRYELLGCKP